MNALEKILTIECSLLAIGIIVVSVLIVYNVRKRNYGGKNNGGKEHLQKKCVILPPTEVPIVELQRPAEQVCVINYTEVVIAALHIIGPALVSLTKHAV